MLKFKRFETNTYKNLQDFILNCSRVSEFFTARGSMSYILGPIYPRALKEQLTVFIDPN